jgi:HSP20 family molecular chaperone IbpA
MTTTAPITWAQRMDALFITIVVPDVDKESAKIELTEGKLTFRCAPSVVAGPGGAKLRGRRASTVAATASSACRQCCRQASHARARLPRDVVPALLSRGGRERQHAAIDDPD